MRSKSYAVVVFLIVASACTFHLPAPTPTAYIPSVPGVTVLDPPIASPQYVIWSLDSKHLFLEDNNQIIMWDLASNSSTLLFNLVRPKGVDTTQVGYLAGGDLSPDGKRLAFYKAIRDSVLEPGIYLMDLTTKASFLLYPEAQDFGMIPIWAPDGQYIYAARCGQRGPRSSFCKIDVLSREVTATYPIAFAGRSIHDLGFLSLSRTGRFLATFATVTEGDSSVTQEKKYIILIDTTSGQLGILSTPPDIQITSQPVWSPKEDLLAFLGRRGSQNIFYLMKSDGTCLTPLFGFPVGVSNETYFPPWSRDGEKIAFISQAKVYMIDLTIAWKNIDSGSCLSFTQMNAP